MTRQLPPPVTVNDLWLAAAVDALDQVHGVLVAIRDRLPEPAGVDPGGPGDPSSDEDEPTPVEISEPAPKPAPLKPAKKTTPKPVKE